MSGEICASPRIAPRFITKRARGLYGVRSDHFSDARSHSEILTSVLEMGCSALPRSLQPGIFGEPEADSPAQLMKKLTATNQELTAGGWMDPKMLRELE